MKEKAKIEPKQQLIKESKERKQFENCTSYPNFKRQLEKIFKERATEGKELL